MAHGGRLEKFKILGEMPWDRAGIPDDPVFGHSHNRLNHLEKRKTADSRAEAQRRRDDEKEILQLFCLKTPRLSVSAGKHFIS
jgi:hypothetical protein